MAELFDQSDPGDWFTAPVAPLDRAAEAAALARQGSLTKPPGSLGRLESVAVRLAALQGTARPSVDRVRIAVFAADHGVAGEGSRPFPRGSRARCSATSPPAGRPSVFWPGP